MRNPFVVGRWVTEPHFFGRAGLIQDLIESHETCHWVIGKRRIGKTSLLRQIERTVQETSQNIALFWDIQGSYDSSGLLDSFIDAIEDSRDLFPEHWRQIDYDITPSTKCHQAIKQVARALHQQFARVTLLIDEAEELINVGRNDAEALGKLRKVMHHTPGLRTVLCSTVRLEQLHQVSSLETSPFLHGFEARFLGHLNRDETRLLLATGFDDRTLIDEIFTLTEGNPFEAQLFGKHVFDQGNVDTVCLEMESNPSLQQVIEVNFDLLNETEQNVLKDIFCGKASLDLFTHQSDRQIIARLERLGYLASYSAQLTVCSHFVRKWLEGRFDRSPSFHSQHLSDPVLTPEDARQMLRQLPALYKFFLEVAGNRQTATNATESFRISPIDSTIYPDKDILILKSSEDSRPFWQQAMLSLMHLIKSYMDTDFNWTLHRLAQMVDDMDPNYTEADFLDLMMLVSEEMELA